MRPRAAFFPSFYKDNKSSRYRQRERADDEMRKAFKDVITKVFTDKRNAHPILSKLSNPQFDVFMRSLIVYYDPFLPHSFFRQTYEEPNGQELVKLFLILIQELPASLAFLKPDFSKICESRLNDILNSELISQLSALSFERILEIMNTNVNFKAMLTHHKHLFVNILWKIKLNILFAKRDINRPLNEKNIHSKTGITVEQALEIAKSLDIDLQNEISVLMMNYLVALVKEHQTFQLAPYQNAIIFDLILLEVKSKNSPLAFYNMQLGFPITRSLLVETIGQILVRKLDEGKSLNQADRVKYFICLIAKFYSEFTDVRLSKLGTVDAANKLIIQISNKKLLMPEKLIQFEVLFALTQHYANTHSNPLDPLLGIDNTRTWKALMSIIRHAAFAQLTKEENYPQPCNPDQYLAVLRSALTLPLFNQHSGNYSGFFLQRTATVTKIEELINQSKTPREMVRYR